MGRAMDTDLMLVTGIMLGLLAVPALISAYSEGRAPRLASIFLLIAGTLIVVALSGRPSGYTFDQMIRAFGNVFSRFVG